MDAINKNRMAGIISELHDAIPGRAAQDNIHDYFYLC